MPLTSMTGFGRSETERDGRKLVVEVKTVNNRYLDINIRLPKALSMLEEAIRSQVKDRLARGRVDLFFTYTNLRKDARETVVDLPLAQGYLAALEQLSQLTGKAAEVSVMDLASLPDMVRITEPAEDEEALRDLVLQGLNDALDQLIAMRLREGAAMCQDMLEKLATVEEVLCGVKRRAPQVVEEYRLRLTARIQELLQDTALDEGRLANEVAIFSDRCSIAEELARLDSHIAQARALLASQEPMGRKLDFLVQEFNREVNTLCSKANDLAVTNAGLTLKNEIEKIREQVQNVE